MPWVILLAGIGLAGNYLGFVKGVSLTSAGHATVISQFGPLLLAIAGIFYFKEHLSRQKMTSIGLATIGFLIFYADQLKASTNLLDFSSGNYWLIFGSLTWAVWGFIQKNLSMKGWHPQLLNMIVFVISSFVLLPFANPEKLIQIDQTTWLLLILLALNTLVSYGSLAIAMNHAPMNQVSLIISCYPILTLIIIQLLDHLQLMSYQPEPLGWLGATGALFVVSGVVLSVKKT